MLQVICQGNAFEIGYQHGSSCKDLVAGSLTFTRSLSLKSSKKTWNEVREIAQQFSVSIQRRWPRYYQEMKGLATGAGCDLLDIVALNCRTEIAFGLGTSQTDGCTNAWMQTPNGALQGQNWDWLLPQKVNLVLLTIKQRNYPVIKMVTEAGMIGKIGLNSVGVGVTYNALFMRGIDFKGLPSHLAMRIALESCSVGEACLAISCQGGMAASAYILVGDDSTARGIEFSSHDIKFQTPNYHGYVAHTNHCIMDHEFDVDERKCPLDSTSRLTRIEGLLRECKGSLEGFSNIWNDEDDAPTGICRSYKEGQSNGETLFNIVIDLKKKEAILKVGRPVAPDEVLKLDFEKLSQK